MKNRIESYSQIEVIKGSFKALKFMIDMEEITLSVEKNNQELGEHP